jgi:hypothetical protein
MQVPAVGALLIDALLHPTLFRQSYFKEPVKKEKKR